MIAISIFAIFDRFLCIALRISFWVSFSGSCFLKRPVFIAGIEIVVPSFLLNKTAGHSFQSRLTGRFSFLNCILQLQPEARAVPALHLHGAAIFFMNMFTAGHPVLFFIIKPTAVAVLRSLAPRALLQATGQFHEHVFAVSTRTIMCEPGCAVLLEPLVSLPRLPLHIAQGLDGCGQMPTCCFRWVFQLVEPSLSSVPPLCLKE